MVLRKSLGVLVLGSALLLSSAALAEDVQVTSSLDKRSVSVGEEIHLTIRVTGPTANLQAPRLPVPDGFDSYYTGRASHMTFVNGVSSSSVEFSYTLIPQKAGRFTIDPVQVQVGMQPYRTDPIVIEVLGDSGQVPSQSASRTSAPVVPQMPSQPQAYPQQTPQAPQPVVSQTPDDNIFVQAWIDRKSVYQNEQLLLTYSLYTRYDTRYEGFEKEPETSGFWIEDFPMEREIERETVRMNGKRYVKADVKKTALFPTAPGTYSIQPGSLKVSIREEPRGSSVFDEFFSDSFFNSGSFFARRQNRLLNPPPIQLTVKPLPESGKPAGFQGAVGQFRISATIDRDKVKQNEPVTMKLTIEGEGNIETLTRPKIPELSGFKTYDADTSSQLFKTGNVIGGAKSFEIAFIPKDEGKVFIPPLDFSFFDPRAERYVTLRTPNFPVTVEKSDQEFKMPEEISAKGIFKKQVKLEAKDISFIAERLPDPLPAKVFHLAYRVLLGLNVLLLIVLGVLFFKSREEEIFSKDEGLKRRKRARAVAQMNLKKLGRLARGTKPEQTAAFFVELEHSLTQYISDKLNLSTYGVTRRDLEEALANLLGAEDPLLKELIQLYDLCDESGFGKGAIPQASKKIGMKIFQDTVNRLERVRS